MSKTSNNYNKNTSKRKKRVARIALFLLISAFLFALFCALYFNQLRQDGIKSLNLKRYIDASRQERSRIYHYDFTDRTQREGTLSPDYDEIIGGYQSIYTPIDKVPDHLKHAFVAIEDKRFFTHNGVDTKRTAAAALNFAKEKLTGNRNRAFGGSTITQQIVKNVSGKDDYTVKRKINEIFEALALEDFLSKDEILEIYLNVINLSGGCRGVGAAAKYYFGKSASELDICESASLAAITNSPSAYNPYFHPNEHLKRRNLIIKQMRAQGYITENDAKEQASRPLELIPKQELQRVNSWYTDMVIEDVIADLCKTRGLSYSEASELVYFGGLKIYSAENREMQNIVNEYFSNKNNFKPLKDGSLPQSSMIIIDPFTGDILAVAGGVGEKRANRIQNYATMTKRPSGSVIKPLSVYAPALDKGIINWASVYDDVPLEFIKDGEEYIAWPKNFSDSYEGLVNVNYALTHSTNTVAVKILRELGKENSFNFLSNKLGMSSLIKSEKLGNKTLSDTGEAALALGQMSVGVTLKEICAAYSIFPNGGSYSKPRSYYKVCDKDGRILLSLPDGNSTKAIRSSSSAIMTKMLQNVVNEGSARYVSLKYETQVAGKTGTTQGDRDKWFVGFTPSLVGGVWSGFDNGESLREYRHNPSLDVWDGVMKKIYAEIDGYNLGEQFNMPQNIIQLEYCKDSGKLCGENCALDPRANRTEIGYFTLNNMPHAHCDTHQRCLYDDEGEGIVPHYFEGAEEFEIGTRHISLIKVLRRFPCEVFVTDAQYVYRYASPDKITLSDFPYFSDSLPKGEFCGISKTKRHFNASSKKLKEIINTEFAQ